MLEGVLWIRRAVEREGYLATALAKSTWELPVKILIEFVVDGGLIGVNSVVLMPMVVHSGLMVELGGRQAGSTQQGLSF